MTDLEKRILDALKVLGETKGKKCGFLPDQLPLERTRTGLVAEASFRAISQLHEKGLIEKGRELLRLRQTDDRPKV